MKTYKGKEVEIRVEPFGESLTHYCIYYREKKKFNLFNTWKRYCYTWSIGMRGTESFDPYQPYLFEKYESALEEAKRLKNNPELIDENNEKRWKRYNEICEDLRKYREERNKTTVI